MIYFKNLYNKYRDYINNFSLFFFANVVQVAIGLFMNPVWASNLSHKDYAIMGYFDSFGLLIFPLISFSLFSFYSKEYFRLDDAGRERTLSSLLIFQLVFGLFSMLLLFCCFKVYFITNNISFPFYPYAFISFFKSYIGNFFTFYLLHLKLKKKAAKYFKINVVYVVFNTILLLLLIVVLKQGAFGNMLALLISTGIFSIYSLFKLIKKIQFDVDIIKKSFHFCWPLILSSILTYFFTGFDKLLLEKNGDFYNFALYNIGFKFASYFVIFTTTINLTFEPDFYEAIATRNKAKLIKICLLINSIIFIPILIFIFSSDLVVGLLTNYRYVEAAPYARILVLSNVTQSISFTLSTIIIATGYSKISLLEKIIGAALTVCLYLLLIHNYGFMGAAWGNVLSYLIMSIISAVLLIYFYKSKHYNKV